VQFSSSLSNMTNFSSQMGSSTFHQHQSPSNYPFMTSASRGVYDQFSFGTTANSYLTNSLARSNTTCQLGTYNVNSVMPPQGNQQLQAQAQPPQQQLQSNNLNANSTSNSSSTNGMLANGSYPITNGISTPPTSHHHHMNMSHFMYPSILA
jgi:hypothetical protein